MIEFIVWGVPRSRPRELIGARINKKTGRAEAFTYRPSKPRIDPKTGELDKYSLQWVRAEEWYAAVKAAAIPVLPPDAPWSGPVRVTIEVYMERPKKFDHPKYPEGRIWAPKKPDRDNLEKNITDPLTEAGLWDDDDQVCDGPVRKFYAPKGVAPHVVIRVNKLEMQA